MPPKMSPASSRVQQMLNPWPDEERAAGSPAFHCRQVLEPRLKADAGKSEREPPGLEAFDHVLCAFNRLGRQKEGKNDRCREEPKNKLRKPMPYLHGARRLLSAAHL